MLYLRSFTLTFYYKALNEQKWIYEIPHSVRNDSSHSVWYRVEEGAASPPPLQPPLPLKLPVIPNEERNLARRFHPR